MVLNLFHLLKDVFAHHRKFTQFQKVIICSIFVGVILSLTRSWWFLFVSLTYTVTLYASVTIAKYIVRCNTYFPSDVILYLYEKIVDILTSLTKSDEKTNENSTNIDSEAKNEVPECEFYDSIEAKKDENALQNLHTELYLERITNCDREISFQIQNIIVLIQQDFIESWYKLFSKEKSVLQEANTILCHSVQSLKDRLNGANTKQLFEFILLMFKDHVRFVKEAEVMLKVQTKSRRRRSSVKPSITVGSMRSSPSKQNIVYKTVEECYGSKNELHVAVKSAEAEHAYQKSIIEMLLVHLLREDMHDSKALFCALKEILTCNVLQKVMDLLSDTTFLHERIIKITSDEEICASIESIPLITVSESETKKVQSILSQRIVSNSVAESEHIPDVISDKQDDGTSDKVKDDSFSVKWKEDIELHSVSEGLCNECNRLCSADKDRIPPRPHSCSLGRTPVFFDISEDPERLSLQSFNSVSSTSSKDSATFASSEKHESDEDMQQCIPDKLREPSLIQKDENSALKPESSSSLKGSNLSKEDSTSSSELPVNDNALESPSGLDNKSSSNIFPSLKIPLFPSFPFKRPSFKSLSPTLESAVSSDMKNKSKNDIKRSHSQGDLTPVSDNMQWPLQRPSVFQDVRITSTEKAKEVGSFGEYTLYNVEYEALYQSDVGELVYKSGTVKRRFKEFINLQSRLEDNPVYKKSMKDVKGPKKILPSLPFGNMGKDTVDSRKELLETFLTSLVGKDDICNGEELKQFLGYCGDGHIAFVRKVPENTGPRIDQRLVKTMSGVFDKIVEGLPSLPQQLPRIIPPINQRDERDDTPGDKPTEDTDDIDLAYEEDINKMSTHKVENVFEKFIEQESNTLKDDTGGLDTTLGTSVITWQDEQGNNSSHMTHSPHKIDATSHDIHSAKKTPHPSALSHLNESETPLSDAVLGILTEVLQRQDHWMCRENVKQAASVLIGKGLNRFLEEKVDFLTSTEMNIFYLKTLSETIWPDGKLSTEEIRHYTDLQKEQLKQQATRCLAEFLPGILQTFVGHEEFDEALKDVIESLKYEKLNRHFWYTVFDVILEELFPEVNTQGFQRKLSAAVQFQ